MSLLPDAVCWYEGMQLLPQHFQLQGLRAEVLAAHLAKAGNPWFWGVEQLEIDPSALCAGQVRILSLEATFPDGLPVTLDAADGARLELDVGDAIDNSIHSMVTVYLAVTPLWRAGQLRELKGRLQSLTSESLQDLTSGQNPQPVTVWRPNPHLCTDTNKADSVCLPLLRIRKEGGGFVQVPYVPPTARLLPESPLGRRVAALCARSREKCLFLAGRLRQAQQAGSQEDAAEIRRQLGALWARLPEVEGLLNSRAASPRDLHGLLLGMAGGWSVLDPLAGVPAFMPLDYLELQRGYEEVLNWLELGLELIRVGYRCLPFEQSGELFSLQLPERQPEQRLVIGLRMPAGAGESAAIEWLERTIIASDSNLTVLARQRMPGLRHQVMSRQEQVAYSVGSDTRLFVVEARGEWFDPEQPLHIIAPASKLAVNPWQIVLFVEQASEAP
ncbi:type VI secretion system baseplate subunit TssK [Pseudomonas gingeri]